MREWANPSSRNASPTKNISSTEKKEKDLYTLQEQQEEREIDMERSTQETIVYRTRSKLSLNDIPLEIIEQAFVPPDITSDMYDVDLDPVVDKFYIEFLKDYTGPLEKILNQDDDPVDDPDFNVLEEEENNDDINKENSCINNSWECLNTNDSAIEASIRSALQENLVVNNSLSNCADKSLSGNVTTQTSIETPTITEIRTSQKPIEAIVFSEQYCLMTKEHRDLLSVQLSQYVQLAAQQYAMTYYHPTLHKHSSVCKDQLLYLRDMKNESGSNSAFNIINLEECLKLIDDWEKKLQDCHFYSEYINYLQKMIEQQAEFSRRRRKYTCSFHPELSQLFLESKGLIHPQLLPYMFPYSDYIPKVPYLKSEENLIALGLEQFIPYAKENNKSLFNSERDKYINALKLCHTYLLPARDVMSLFHHIKNLKKSKTQNVVKQYFETGLVSKVIHCFMLVTELIAPMCQPLELLPTIWQDYISNLKYNINNFIKIAPIAPKESETYVTHRIKPDPDMPVNENSVIKEEPIDYKEEHYDEFNGDQGKDITTSSISVHIELQSVVHSLSNNMPQINGSPNKSDVPPNVTKNAADKKNCEHLPLLIKEDPEKITEEPRKKIFCSAKKFKKFPLSNSKWKRLKYKESFKRSPRIKLQQTKLSHTLSRSRKLIKYIKAKPLITASNRKRKLQTSKHLLTHANSSDSSDEDENKIESMTIENIEFSSDSESCSDEENVMKYKPWSKAEDKILLENIQKNYNEATLVQVSDLLGNRSLKEVKRRCNYLLSLIQKMG